jgi:hypothetical protein
MIPACPGAITRSMIRNCTHIAEMHEHYEHYEASLSLFMSMILSIGAALVLIVYLD